MSNRSLLSFVAAVFLLVGEAAAHDVWLCADGHGAGGSPRVAERVDVRLLVGHGAEEPEPVTRNDRLIAEFSARGPEGETKPVPGLHGIDPAGIFRPDRPGLWSVVYEGRPVEHRLDAVAFESYLEEEGLEWVQQKRRRAGDTDQPGRELFSRSLEALVPVAGADGADFGNPRMSELDDGRRPTEGLLPVQFRLTREGPGEARLQLLAAGRPVPGALIDLRRDGRPVASLRTDGEGNVRLRPEPGVWVVTAVVMEAVEDPRADWRTIFAALTFPWPEAAGEGSVGPGRGQASTRASTRGEQRADGKEEPARPKADRLCR